MRGSTQQLETLKPIERQIYLINPEVNEKRERMHYEKQIRLVIHRLNADRQCIIASEER